VFLVLLALSGRWPGIVVVAALVPLLLLALLGLAAGVFLGVVHVFFRDVGHVLAIVLQVWFWLTPIVYPVHILPPSYAKWIGINPVTPIVEALQAIFVQHQWPVWPTLAYPAVLAMALGLLSATVFRRQAPWIVDEL
jgi:lipopolysaccharide transport system permease protein